MRLRTNSVSGLSAAIERSVWQQPATSEGRDGPCASAVEKVFADWCGSHASQNRKPSWRSRLYGVLAAAGVERRHVEEVVQDLERARDVRRGGRQVRGRRASARAPRGRASRTNGRMRFSSSGGGLARERAQRELAAAQRAHGRAEALRGRARAPRRALHLPERVGGLPQRRRQLAHGRGDVLVLGRVGAEDARAELHQLAPGRRSLPASSPLSSLERAHQPAQACARASQPRSSPARCRGGWARTGG